MLAFQLACFAGFQHAPALRPPLSARPPGFACQQGLRGSFLRSARQCFYPEAVSLGATGYEPHAQELTSRLQDAVLISRGEAGAC